MTDRLRILHGRVYDPAEGVDGVVKTVYIRDGRIVAPWSDGDNGRTIDAAGMVVMPGGIDVHCHIAGPTVNRARRLLPEQAARDPRPARRLDGSGAALRAGAGGLVPSTFVTGYKYAGLGYTGAMEAAVAPSGARQAHFELADTPNLDRGFLLLLANNRPILDALARGETRLARDLAAVYLARTGAYGIKAVNPGAVDAFKHGGPPAPVASIDAKLGSTAVTPRMILEALTAAANDFALPHSLHIHCNRLGLPGNVSTTLETSRALAGRRHHLTHIQFHSYGDDGAGGFASGAAALIEHVNARPEVTCDVGQVMFGPAVTMTEDSPVEHLLWQLTGRRWVNVDVEMESGCGLLPFEFKDKVFLHTLQWAIGLELFLLAQDPWRVALSTDHPNGGSFAVYPRLIATLMDRGFRQEEMKRANPTALDKTKLRDLDREYTLSEIAIITRAGPARILGLVNKGRLGVGADADVTVYDDKPDRLAMFQTPRYVIKAGRVVVQEGQIRDGLAGRTVSCRPPVEPAAERALREWFAEFGSYDFEQLRAGAASV
jgi:formylmethanofuran dehydrogenase subunit A